MHQCRLRCWHANKCASPGHGSAAQRAPVQGRLQAGRELPRRLCGSRRVGLLWGDRHLICCHIMAQRHRQEIGKAPVCMYMCMCVRASRTAHKTPWRSDAAG